MYNIFDWFGDVGGFQGFILIFSSTLATFFSGTLNTIQKAEAIYRSAPWQKTVILPADQSKLAGARLAPPANDLASILRNFASLTPFRVSCGQKLALIFTGKCCRTREQKHLWMLLEESQLREQKAFDLDRTLR